MRDTRDPAAGHDSAVKWPAFADWDDAAIARETWSARPALGLRRVLVSGDLAAARSSLAAQAKEVGLWGECADDRVVARIARDRAMIVSTEALNFSAGWHGEGWAATVADDTWLAIDIAGEAMRDVVAEAVSADLDRGSPSAAVRFAGVPALLYRVAADTARLHVEFPLAPYVWRWLEERPD